VLEQEYTAMNRMVIATGNYVVVMSDNNGIIMQLRYIQQFTINKRGGTSSHMTLLRGSYPHHIPWNMLHAVRIWPSRGPCDSGPFLLGVRSCRTPSKNSPAVSRAHSGQTRTDIPEHLHEWTLGPFFL
jgi:hypothetical protein